jgi:hypothetical protein
MVDKGSPHVELFRGTHTLVLSGTDTPVCAPAASAWQAAIAISLQNVNSSPEIKWDTVPGNFARNPFSLSKTAPTKWDTFAEHGATLGRAQETCFAARMASLLAGSCSPEHRQECLCHSKATKPRSRPGAFAGSGSSTGATPGWTWRLGIRRWFWFLRGGLTAIPSLLPSTKG